MSEVDLILRERKSTPFENKTTFKGCYTDINDFIHIFIRAQFYKQLHIGNNFDEKLIIQYMVYIKNGQAKKLKLLKKKGKTD